MNKLFEIISKMSDGTNLRFYTNETKIRCDNGYLDEDKNKIFAFDVEDYLISNFTDGREYLIRRVQ